MNAMKFAGTDGRFPISRDPPEGGTLADCSLREEDIVEGFQFLGIPPKGEPVRFSVVRWSLNKFPISRDPPEGGTYATPEVVKYHYSVSNF